MIFFADILFSCCLESLRSPLKSPPVSPSKLRIVRQPHSSGIDQNKMWRSEDVERFTRVTSAATPVASRWWEHWGNGFRTLRREAAAGGFLLLSLRRSALSLFLEKIQRAQSVQTLNNLQNEGVQYQLPTWWRGQSPSCRWGNLHHPEGPTRSKDCLPST